MQDLTLIHNITNKIKNKLSPPVLGQLPSTCLHSVGIRIHFISSIWSVFVLERSFSFSVWLRCSFICPCAGALEPVWRIVPGCWALLLCTNGRNHSVTNPRRNWWVPEWECRKLAISSDVTACHLIGSSLGITCHKWTLNWGTLECGWENTCLLGIDVNIWIGNHQTQGQTNWSQIDTIYTEITIIIITRGLIFLQNNFCNSHI